jgi:hypothetical protein
MADTKSKAGVMIRCAGPNCGVLKAQSDRWWMMWTSHQPSGEPLLHLTTWDEQVAESEGAVPVCGELCAQKLQSQFMNNVLQSRKRR